MSELKLIVGISKNISCIYDDSVRLFYDASVYLQLHLSYKIFIVSWIFMSFA